MVEVEGRKNIDTSIELHGPFSYCRYRFKSRRAEKRGVVCRWGHLSGFGWCYIIRFEFALRKTRVFTFECMLA